jgi:hypothetical protein
MRRNWTSSIVPTASGDDQTIYLVVNNFGHLGIAFTEGAALPWRCAYIQKL